MIEWIVSCVLWRLYPGSAYPTIDAIVCPNALFALGWATNIYHLHGDVAWQWPTRFAGRFNPTMVS
jgi:hypothetical protein